MTSEITAPADGYGPWLGELKARFRQVQLKAAVAVNSAMLQFYWELGADMVVKQKQFAWGSGFVSQLSADLMREFPEAQILVTGVEDPHSRAHSPNESLHLATFHHAMLSEAMLLQRLDAMKRGE